MLETVHLVEDDPARHGRIAQLLQRLGYGVADLLSRECRALRANDGSAPRAVILSGPATEPLDCLRVLIRARHLAPHLPIVALLPCPSPELTHDVRTLGAIPILWQSGNMETELKRAIAEARTAPSIRSSEEKFLQARQSLPAKLAFIHGGTWRLRREMSALVLAMAGRSATPRPVDLVNCSNACEQVRFARELARGKMPDLLIVCDCDALLRSVAAKMRWLASEGQHRIIFTSALTFQELPSYCRGLIGAGTPRFDLSPEEHVLTGPDGHVRSLRELERAAIAGALRQYRGRISETARRLGIGRSTLYRKMHEAGFDREGRAIMQLPEQDRR